MSELADMSKFPKKKMTPLTEEELNAVTIVFHQYETGLREGTIYTRDLLPAMKALGLSPTEQEVVDMQCEVERRGRIFFPDFCNLCLRKFREFNEENFKQELFKNLCGTEPHPVRFRAKKYKINEKFFTLADFKHMMTHLPEPVSEQDIMEMFSFADKNKDGQISYDEFLIMITPVKVPEGMVGPAVLGYTAPPPMFPGLDPAPAPNLDAGATPLLEGSVVGGEGATEGPAVGSIQGDAVVATSSQGGQPTIQPTVVNHDVAVATLVTTAE